MSYNFDSIVTGEVSYTPAEKELRDRFIAEYVRDYNAYGACVRLGYHSEDAFEVAKMLGEDSYVKRGITQAEESRVSHLRTSKENDLSILPEGFIPHDVETDKQRIVSGLFREAFYKGPGGAHSSRVSALTTLAKIYKLDKEEKSDDKVTTNVMVVPAMGSVDSWEAQAAMQQQKLKSQVLE